MSLPYGEQFCAEVMEIARKREIPLAQVAKDFGIDVSTIHKLVTKRQKPGYSCRSIN